MLLQLLSLAICQLMLTVSTLSGILACVHKITRSASGSPLATPDLNSEGLAVSPLLPQATKALMLAKAVGSGGLAHKSTPVRCKASVSIYGEPFPVST